MVLACLSSSMRWRQWGQVLAKDLQQDELSTCSFNGVEEVARGGQACSRYCAYGCAKQRGLVICSVAVM